MEINRCMNCMSEVGQPQARYCPVCGFDHQSVEQPVYALRMNSILHGRYLIGRVLGQGGFGITYVGLDMVLDLKVAIKEYFPMGMVTRQDLSATLLWNPSQASQTQRQNGCNSFLKEARKMAKTDANPTIVRVRDTFLENETAYIIMDFVEGETLKAKLLKNGPMSYSECIALLRPMLEGLAKVHKQGMIHRDISPDNIMIQPDGDVKLLDLGAAKDVTISNGQSSQVVAKKGFSPLEQYVEKGRIGSWTDVYALCATIYYCITGKMLPEAMDRMYHQEELQFPALAEPLSKGVTEALEQGLAIKTEDRIQDVDELLRRLEEKSDFGNESLRGQKEEPVIKEKSLRGQKEDSVIEEKSLRGQKEEPVIEKKDNAAQNTRNMASGPISDHASDSVSQTTSEKDNGGFLWGLLGCCIPIAGLVLFLVYKDQKPKTAKAAGIGAITCIVLIILFYVLIFIIALMA